MPTMPTKPNTPTVPTPPTLSDRIERGRIKAAERFPAGGADVLAMAFGTVVAMWVIGFVGRIPAVNAPGWMLGGFLLGAMVLGGLLTGRLTERGGLGGFAVGLMVAFVNVLILGGALTEGGEGGPGVGAVVIGVAGFVIACGIVMGMAGKIGAAIPAANRRDINWTGWFAIVAAVAVGVMMVVGGLVTSNEAGLAVKGWPDSDGVFMFMYPLSRMTGNVYYEHAHRLYGSLLGLITIVLTLHVVRHRVGVWVKVLAGCALAAVVMQGVLGGLRVYLAHEGGGVEVAAAEHETQISITLRVAHGVFGQVYLGLMVALAAFLSAAWRRVGESNERVLGLASGDRLAAAALVGLLLVQLFLGAILRHANQQLMMHLTGAILVVFLGMGVGMRCWARHGEKSRVLWRIGLGISVLIMVQIGLGFGALVARTQSTEGQPAHWADVVFSTAHQANGAALLASAVLAAVFVHRLSDRHSSLSAESSPVEAAAG